MTVVIVLCIFRVLNKNNQKISPTNSEIELTVCCVWVLCCILFVFSLSLSQFIRSSPVTASEKLVFFLAWMNVMMAR